MDWNLSHMYGKYFKIYWPVFFITFLIVFVFVPNKNFLQLLDFFKFFTFRLTALIVVQCWLHYVVTLCWKCEQGNGNGSVHLSKCALQCWPVNLHSDWWTSTCIIVHLQTDCQPWKATNNWENCLNTLLMNGDVC